MNCGKEMQERPVAQRRTRRRDAKVRCMTIAVRLVMIYDKEVTSNVWLMYLLVVVCMNVT